MEVNLKLYNTLTRRKEVLKPLEAGQVKMYVCGVTTYDSCHVGHARAVVVFDVIYRFLQALGYRVIYVRNFTDVDDKIIKRAQAEGVTSQAISQRYIDEFHEEMALLGVAKPQQEPRVTGHIPEIVAMIQELVDRGLAYEGDGSVFFAVKKFPGYGRLSSASLDEMLAGSRVEADAGKRDPLDFALWKRAKPGEPAWESPWGPGRPGWHIECSAMSRKYLGESFDIHGGGQDLIFPHHENEIAQSEAITGHPFVQYWLHNGMVTSNREKMSKSLGNVLTLQELFERFHPEVVRCYLLSTHYHNPMDISIRGLEDANKGLDRLYGTLARLHRADAKGVQGGRTAMGRQSVEKTKEAERKFLEAMADDCNSALALAVLFEWMKGLNATLEGEAGEIDQPALEEALQFFAMARQILGLFNVSPHAWFQSVAGSAGATEMADAAVIQQMIAERELARSRRDWETADRIRGKLKQRHIVLEDQPGGSTTWRLERG